ncbi:MAG: hypothetical protein LKCHEGNO_02684 [Burkholderiaceae bacterium]|nr:hypothetical protein [Burkholderiaceae bacterium]
MYGPITIPFGAKMLFNMVKLKPGVTLDDVEEALAELCEVVKQNYGGDRGGFFAGQVFRLAGFVSAEGSLNDGGAAAPADHDIAIVTYWRSFAEHERSHADKLFLEKFSALAAHCTESREPGYDMLWQGMHAEGSQGVQPALAGAR